jgi:hypothetical protein
MTKPCSGQVQRRLPIRERTNHTRSPADLTQDPHQLIIGAHPSPVNLRELVIGQGFSTTPVSTSGAALSSRIAHSLVTTCRAFLRAACTSSLAGLPSALLPPPASSVAAHAKRCCDINKQHTAASARRGNAWQRFLLTLGRRRRDQSDGTERAVSDVRSRGKCGRPGGVR